MISKDEFVRLYQKFLEGQCTPEEIEQLESYTDETSLTDETWLEELGDRDILLNKLKNRVHRTLGMEDEPKRLFSRRWFKIAASLLFLLSATLIIWELRSPKTKDPAYAVQKDSKKIVPGGNKAYLTMSNGSVITLNGAANGILASQSGVQVSKVKEGVLKYAAATKGSSVDNAFNLIETPRGGQYEVELADGTHVWLNSATSLKYPANFAGGERKVELSGEAYFEVAKDPSRPFRVMVNGVAVQVLGTHFNVMGYKDEKTIKTTLLEGSVRLSVNGKDAILKPGEQGLLNASQNGFEVAPVDVDDVVAWKNGLFAFNNEDIQTIMRRISRWYDVDVIFPEHFRRKNFGGSVSRFDDVSEVLKSLELTNSVHFKIEGRRIFVMP